MNKTYGRTWLESNARNGSMSAIQLSQAELLYNPEYARQCDAFGDKVENEWRKSNRNMISGHPVNRNLLSGRFIKRKLKSPNN